MKNIYFILFIFLFSQLSFAQKEGNIWFMGGGGSNPIYTNHLIDFNDTPFSYEVVVQDYLTNGAATCISDSSGQLLLYTNGESIKDKNHNYLAWI